MQLPNIRSTIKDPDSDVIFHVIAYRALSKAEMIEQVREFMSSNKRRRQIKPGQTIKIFTIIGHDQ